MENQGSNTVNQNVNMGDRPLLSMKFHNFYKWWLIITGVIVCNSCIIKYYNKRQHLFK